MPQSLTCTHKQTQMTEREQAWVDLILVRCVVSWRSNEGKGEVKSQGWQRWSPMGPRRLSSTGFDPFTCAHAHTLRPHADSWGGHRQAKTSPSEPSICTKALGHRCTNRFWHFTAHLRRLHIFVWDCFYNSHCGSLSPTLVAYAGGGSLSGSQWICCSVNGGLWGRRWGRWESIL